MRREEIREIPPLRTPARPPREGVRGKQERTGEEKPAYSGRK
jgi:hypothetical protein